MRVCKTCLGDGKLIRQTMYTTNPITGEIQDIPAAPVPCPDCAGDALSREELYELAFLDGYEVAEAEEASLTLRQIVEAVQENCEISLEVGPGNNYQTVRGKQY